MSKVPVITDTEGVLVNTLDNYVEICNLVRDNKGLPPLPKEEYRRNRIRGWWPDTLKELGIDDEESAAIYGSLRNFTLSSERNVQLYEGVEDLFNFLQLHPLYLPILKSASRHLNILRARFNLDRYFSAVVSTDPITRDFIDKSFELAKDEQPLSAGIVVDDQSENLENARKYGRDKGVRILTIGVTYGFYSPERIMAVYPDKVAHTPTEVVEILKEFEETLRVESSSP